MSLYIGPNYILRHYFTIDLLRRVKPINLKISFIQNDTYNYIQYRKTTDVSDNLFVHNQGNVILDE